METKTVGSLPRPFTDGMDPAAAQGGQARICERTGRGRRQRVKVRSQERKRPREAELAATLASEREGIEGLASFNSLSSRTLGVKARRYYARTRNTTELRMCEGLAAVK